MRVKEYEVSKTSTKSRARGKRSLEGPGDGGLSAPPAEPATSTEIRWLGAFYIVTAFILFYLLFKAWPPQPWPTDKETGENVLNAITFFARFPSLRFEVHTSLDERLFFLVIVAGALGSYIHAATSFADYVGNRKLTKSWIWWYILRPFVGVALALIFYFVIRAGFLTGGAGDVSPYGVATLGALSGMFSKQATDKLEEVFTTIFRPAPGKGDAKRGDKLSAPTISGLTPKEGPTSGGTEVIITGSGFVDKPSVKFGDMSAAVTFENATTIKAITPKQEPGEVEVVVTNPDGQEGSPKERFTYVETTGDEGDEGGDEVEGEVIAGDVGVAGADDVETIDGCDVDIIEETPDEDLPRTEGGVA